MLLIFTKRRWGNYWQLLRRWFEHKIDELKAAVNSVAQSIDFTPVEEKLDDVKSDVADVKTAVEHIDFSTLAKQGDNPAATNSAILEAMSHISPEDPYSQALAAFFNITPPVPNAVPMTQQEVEDDLDELWNLIITQ